MWVLHSIQLIQDKRNKFEKFFLQKSKKSLFINYNW